ncbi:MAG: ATP-binding protein [Elainellaceae cyanobacterium]
MPKLSSIPLNAVLVIPFLLEVFAAVGLVGFFSLRNGERAVLDLATQLQKEVSDRIDLHLEHYLSASTQVNRINAEAIRLGKLNVNDAEAMEQRFWQQIRIFSTLEYIYFGHQERGGYAGVGRSDTEWPDIEETEDYVAGDFLIYETDAQGNRKALTSRTPGYDPRRRDWYEKSMARGRMGWSEIYGFFPDSTLGISATLPIYGADEKLLGVIGSDLVLSGIQEFLANLDILETGQAFLIERDGRLIASSHAEAIFVPPEDEDAELERIDLARAEDVLLQLTGETLQDELPNLDEVQRPVQLSFRHEGQLYLIQISPVRNEQGLDWLVGVILPESAFIEQINANTRTTIRLCALALLIATLLGVATSYWIKRRLTTLTEAAHAMSRGELEQKIDPTQLRELDDLGQSFNIMAEKLQQVIGDLENSNATLENSNATLEKRVSERTVELSTTLKNLKRTQSQLIQTEKMSSLGQLVAGIAHEINNPLNFVSGNLAYTKQYTEELLSILNLYQECYPKPNPVISDYLNATDIEFLKNDFPNVIRSMKLGTDRILKIVSSLKGFSHLHEAEQKAVDIHRGLDSTLTILQSELKASDTFAEIDVVTDYGDLPLVECYPDRLCQVFMNLLSNAIDALHDETNPETCGVKPQIKICTSLKGNSQVEISIADNGPGISKAIQSRLYDPFFTTKPTGKGTGLGLSISFQIVVEQHRGTLECISNPGEGARFIVSLPIGLDTGNELVVS